MQRVDWEVEALARTSVSTSPHLKKHRTRTCVRDHQAIDRKLMFSCASEELIVMASLICMDVSIEENESIPIVRPRLGSSVGRISFIEKPM